MLARMVFEMSIRGSSECEGIRRMEMRSSTRSTVFLAVFAAAMLTGATVMAAPITLPVSPLFIQYTNDEQFSVSNSIHSTNATTGAVTSEGNWGILQISSIVRGTALNPLGSDIQGGGASVFAGGGPGGPQITGIFYGTHVNGPSGLSATGGVIDLYWRDVGTANTGADLAAGFDPARRLNQKTYTGYAEPLNPSFIFLAQLVYGPGCDSGGANHVCTGVAPGTGDGTAKSYQSVNLAAGGLWASQLDTNFFTLDANGQPMSPQDVRSDSNFSVNGASAWNNPGGCLPADPQPCDIIGLRSNDPVRALVTPEPATLTLFGLGLLGAGFMRRRKQK
jgi:PEP-CTERM motif-containing protein